MPREPKRTLVDVTPICRRLLHGECSEEDTLMALMFARYLMLVEEEEEKLAKLKKKLKKQCS